MVDKYIALLNGIETEVPGTVTGGTTAQAGDIPALDPTGRLHPSLMPVGVGADAASLTAHENLAAGAVVYIRSDGTAANATAAVNGFGAKGFVLASVTAGQTALVYFEGRNTSLSGLTPGARYYLSDTTPGAIMATPIDNVGSGNAGKLHQFVGTAITATSLNFEPDDVVRLG